jgi:hypothetical protein
MEAKPDVGDGADGSWERVNAPSPLASKAVPPLEALALPEGLVERAPTTDLAPCGGGGGAGAVVVVVVVVVRGGAVVVVGRAVGGEGVTRGAVVLVVRGTVVVVLVAVPVGDVVVEVLGTVVVVGDVVVVVLGTVVVGDVVVVVEGGGGGVACGGTFDTMAASPMAWPAAQHAAPAVQETPDSSPQDSSAGTPTSLQVLPPSTVSTTTGDVPLGPPEPTAKQSLLSRHETASRLPPPSPAVTALGAPCSVHVAPPSVVLRTMPT